MNSTLGRFHEDCRAYYASPRQRHNTSARVRAYKSLLRRHSAATLNRHVRAIGSVLTRVELKYATGEEAGLRNSHRADAERIWRACGIAAALNYIAAMRELEVSDRC